MTREQTQALIDHLNELLDSDDARAFDMTFDLLKAEGVNFILDPETEQYVLPGEGE